MANQVLYGFHGLTDVFDRVVNEIDVRVVETAIQESINQHNQVINELVDLFVTRTTEFKIVYRTGTAARLQPLDENGRALPIRGGAQFDRMFPIKEAGTAWGRNNRETRLRMTVQQLNQILGMQFDADRTWLRDQILGALFTNVSYNVSEDIEDHGALTILPLANGDSETYWMTGGGVSPETSDHFKFINATIDDNNNPYAEAYDLLTSFADNGPNIIALIPTGLRAATEALTTFFPVRDPRIQVGSATDVMIGGPSVEAPGIYIGYVDGVDVFVWKQMPANYIVFLATGGQAPIAMRESDLAAMRGFQMWAERVDEPWWERQFLRKAGFGTWNRTAAAVYKMSASSYTIPTGYQQPFA